MQADADDNRDGWRALRDAAKTFGLRMQNAAKSTMKDLETTPSKKSKVGGDGSTGGILTKNTGVLLLQAVRTLAEVQAQAVSMRIILLSQLLTDSASHHSSRMARAGSGGPIVRRYG
jgi:hypothetical protein